MCAFPTVLYNRLNNSSGLSDIKHLSFMKSEFLLTAFIILWSREALGTSACAHPAFSSICYCFKILNSYGEPKRSHIGTCLRGVNNGLSIQMFSTCLWFFFFFLINLFIYLFMAVLGLRFCVRAFSSCGKRGPLFITVRGPLTVAASLVAEHRLQTRRLSSCGSRAQLLRGMWDPPRPGLEPVSPALAGRLSTTAPPGKPLSLILSDDDLYPTSIVKSNERIFKTR